MTQGAVLPFVANAEAELVIDLRALPEKPDVHSIRRHAHKEFTQPWNFEDVILMPAAGTVHEALAAFNGVLVLNANPIEPIVALPHCVPEDWHNTTVYFPGTVLADTGGRDYIRGIKFGPLGQAKEVQMSVNSRFPNPKDEKTRFAVYSPR